MTALRVLERRVAELRRDADRRVGVARHLVAERQRLRGGIDQLQQQADDYERAAHLLSRIGTERQERVQRQIEQLVTQGLHTIFDPGLSFHLVPTIRYKQPVIDFVIRSKANGVTVETDVMEARGGGLAATVGFMLRLVVLLLTQQGRDTVLVLDETFAFLSEDRHDAMAQFLREVTDKTGIQILMVTHTPALAEHADVLYYLALGSEGITKISRVDAA